VSLTAEDLWPLVQKLSREEQLRLARRALASRSSTDATAYERQPVGGEEFGPGDDDALAWESGGWDTP
jgi:hypothetical protein